MGLIVIIYAFVSYWAANKTIYANKTFFGSAFNIFLHKAVYSFFLGLFLIPVAIIKTIRGK